MPTDEPADPAAILSGLARAKALFQGRAIAAALGDAGAHGTGAVRITVDGITHVPIDQIRAAPSPETWESETNKDRTAREDRP